MEGEVPPFGDRFGFTIKDLISSFLIIIYVYIYISKLDLLLYGTKPSFYLKLADESLTISDYHKQLKLTRNKGVATPLPEVEVA